MGGDVRQPKKEKKSFVKKANDLLMRNGDLLMQAAVLLIKNGFPIAMPIAVGTNWPEFTPADNPAFIVALAGRPNQSLALVISHP